jgi:hypothetical protein
VNGDVVHVFCFLLGIQARDRRAWLRSAAFRPALPIAGEVTGGWRRTRGQESAEAATLRQGAARSPNQPPRPPIFDERLSDEQSPGLALCEAYSNVRKFLSAD